MKLRTDLLEQVTAQDILEEAVATNHRFKPEPLLSKTGTGSLLSASTAERASEVERSTALIRKLRARAKAAGKPKQKTIYTICFTKPLLFVTSIPFC